MALLIILLRRGFVRGLVVAASPQFLVRAVACRTRGVRNDGLSVPSVVVACDLSFLVRDPCYSPSCPDAVVALGLDCGVSALFVRGLVDGGVSASSRPLPAAPVACVTMGSESL